MLTNITPDSPKLIWKLHRLCLKASLVWFNLVFPDGSKKTVKYFSEGKFNYLFYVKNDARLLKIRKDQFYRLSELVGADDVAKNCELMNSLAELGISVPGTPIGGGACLVEHAGALLGSGDGIERTQLHDLFKRIETWSLRKQLVLLDYNEGNWCLQAGDIRLVDVDINFACSLSQMRDHKIVQRRVDVNQFTDNGELLKSFLRAEEKLLWSSLRSKCA